MPDTAVKCRPIPFSDRMSLAIGQGRKTQTRRIVKPQPDEVIYFGREPTPYRISTGIPDIPQATLKTPIPCPYGAVGDQLWVREWWRTAKELDEFNATQIAEKCFDAGYARPWCPVEYRADKERRNWDKACWGEPGRWRTGRFMPRWLSRYTLELTAVRVERLKEITTRDCIREGMERHTGVRDGVELEQFRELWEKLNGADSWDANPWLWALSFKRVT